MPEPDRVHVCSVFSLSVSGVWYRLFQIQSLNSPPSVLEHVAGPSPDPTF